MTILVCLLCFLIVYSLLRLHGDNGVATNDNTGAETFYSTCVATTLRKRSNTLIKNDIHKLIETRKNASDFSSAIQKYLHSLIHQNLQIRTYRPTHPYTLYSTINRPTNQTATPKRPKQQKHNQSVSNKKAADKLQKLRQLFFFFRNLLKE